MTDVMTWDETPSAVEGQEGSGLLSLDGHAMPVKFHPLAQLFPMIEGAEFTALVEDVKTNGVRRAVVLFEGMILDGRNRYMAARDAGVGYPVVEFTGPDPVAFVVSENLRRRHMTESQRGMVAARLAKMPRGGDQRSDQSANLRNGPTAAEAAQQLNVSPRMVETARVVVRDGAPSLVAAVDAGSVSVSAAADVARLPEDLQTDVVAEGPDAVREVAKTIREDATVLEKLDAGDPETVATVRAQIMDVVQNPTPRAVRQTRANPAYEPNPARDDAVTVGDCANQITEAFGRRGATILSALPDNATRARAIAKITRARDALTTILEQYDGTH